MSAVFNQVIENIRNLSPRERALVAHCLISSLETEQDEGVDEAWASLSEARLAEVESGAVKGLTWDEIKDQVKG